MSRYEFYIFPSRWYRLVGGLVIKLRKSYVEILLTFQKVVDVGSNVFHIFQIADFHFNQRS